MGSKCWLFALLLVCMGTARADVFIQNVRVWDGVSESLTPLTSVLVRDNKIAVIGVRDSDTPSQTRTF